VTGARSTTDGARAFLARWRVSLGFVFAGVILWLATPTRESFLTGSAVATLGEWLRVWAAGHLEKSREVTQSGPYRFTRHPLYLGSSLIGVGFAVIANNVATAFIVIAYLGLTLTAAMRSEEAHLREKFGDAYDAYVERRAPPAERRFSWSRALRNREHHTLAGLAAGLLAMWLKIVA
jgi:protein-S-isoprenylcysteine O-methyltransferase Ste14